MKDRYAIQKFHAPDDWRTEELTDRVPVGLGVNVRVLDMEKNAIFYPVPPARKGRARWYPLTP